MVDQSQSQVPVQPVATSGDAAKASTGLPAGSGSFDRRNAYIPEYAACYQMPHALPPGVPRN